MESVHSPRPWGQGTGMCSVVLVGTVRASVGWRLRCVVRSCPGLSGRSVISKGELAMDFCVLEELCRSSDHRSSHRHGHRNGRLVATVNRAGGESSPPKEGVVSRRGGTSSKQQLPGSDRERGKADVSHTLPRSVQTRVLLPLKSILFGSRHPSFQTKRVFYNLN